jgi:hypothetical protein
MNKKVFVQMVSGLAVTIGLALAVHWRIAGSPNQVLVGGLGLIAGGAVLSLWGLGLIEFQRKRGIHWDGADGGFDGDGGGD